MKLSVSYFITRCQWVLTLLCSVFLAVNATAGVRFFAELVAITEPSTVNLMASYPTDEGGEPQSVDRVRIKGILLGNFDSSQTSDDATRDAGFPRFKSILSDIGANDETGKPKYSYLGKLGEAIFDLAKKEGLTSEEKLDVTDYGLFSKHIKQGWSFSFIPLTSVQTNLTSRFSGINCTDIVNAYAENTIDGYTVYVVTADGHIVIFRHEKVEGATGDDEQTYPSLAPDAS